MQVATEGSDLHHPHNPHQHIHSTHEHLFGHLMNQNRKLIQLKINLLSYLGFLLFPAGSLPRPSSLTSTLRSAQERDWEQVAAGREMEHLHQSKESMKQLPQSTTVSGCASLLGCWLTLLKSVTF